MAVRRKPRRNEAQLAFEALTIEGGLLSPDWLSRIAQLSAGSQTEADYGIAKGLNLRDEIGRFWRIAQAHWQDFSAARESAADPQATSERFVLGLLREGFGFASLAPAALAVIAERAYPIGYAALGGRVPVIIAPAPPAAKETELDTPMQTFGDGSRRRSPFGLAQEYLNAADGALWGITSDGLKLRILRDNSSLTRPAWIEADLGRIFIEELYADFAALWLLAHESRFGRADQPVTACAMETWRDAGREEGTRAREQLRRLVEEALLSLGQGFLSHPDNTALKAALHDGSLTKDAYFQQLLRLVYRVIFVLTVEERGLLHPDGVPEAAIKLYAEGYSLKRLRERSIKRNAHDRFSDLWEAQKIVFRSLAKGEPRLALPALAGIFAKTQCPDLDAAKLENRSLLFAVFKLAWLREQTGLSRINWRDMGPEELGSVYESLLELVPQITQDGRTFTFASGSETKGNARKTTGSYYTPDSLVQVLLDSALEPVVQSTITANPDNPVEALLKLSIVDPACGSGHFLLAAARRLAAHVARAQTNGTPSAAEYRHALRQVVGRCIYGVDLNPMAVELCKVSLWMEAVEPGLPLSFLNSHIQHGNALLGTTPALMESGIPDVAWDAIEGDDKKIASALKKRNKQANKRALTLDTLWSAPEQEAEVVARSVADLEAVSDVDVFALESKEAQWTDILDSETYRHQRFVADAWCAAFVWPKAPGPLAEAAPTNDLWWQIRDKQGHPPDLTVKTINELALQYRFFHWHLAFPQVFKRGGFNVVLGNPPWELTELKEKEWFAERRPEIAAARNGALRKKMIAELAVSSPELHQEFIMSQRFYSGSSYFLGNSGRFPFCGRGRINLYAVFAELMRDRLKVGGHLGCVVPSGIATDDTTKFFFQDIVMNRSIVSLLDFENVGFFPSAGQGHMNRFCLLCVTSDEEGPSYPSFVFRAQKVDDTRDEDKIIRLSADDLELLNPNTRTCPAFRSRRDSELAKAIYRLVPVFVRDIDEGQSGENRWGVSFRQGLFNSTSASHLFRTADELSEENYRLHGNQYEGDKGTYLPLYEAKMMQLFNHRYGDYQLLPDGHTGHILPDIPDSRLANPDYCVLPHDWVYEKDVDNVLAGTWSAGWLLGFRKVTNDANARTLVISVLPKSGLSDSVPLIFPGKNEMGISHCLLAILSSFVLDYITRLKMGGTNLNFYILRQLPVLDPQLFHKMTPWSVEILKDWMLKRVIELTYTAWDLEPFARDVGYDGPPFRWDPERRFLLRCELDAGFFHLYGLSHDDADYILDTFPVVRKNDEKAHGEYRTKRVILEIYDAMAEAIRTGQTYQTLLDPPPADPKVAHPPRTGALPPLAVPHVISSLTPEEEIARFVWAILHANGGAIGRMDLARAFALRSQPKLLVKLASGTVAPAANEWAERVGTRNVVSGQLVVMLRHLESRSGIRLLTDNSRSMVGHGEHTPSIDLIDPWSIFEARLSMAVLDNLAPNDLVELDSGFSGEERAFLESIAV